MSITINSNILSLNAQRRLGQHTSNLRSSFEKLSSGLRVSKASDDAAGLSISENLKTDARLSSQALRNVNDGISMISIISGALDSQKSILFRMAELAEQSANGVNSKQQRTSLQKEYMTLISEFDRVASSAKFNDISLLRNINSNTVSIMAGINGADSSLLSIAAANSHSYSGTTGLRVDYDDDGFVLGNDLGMALSSLDPDYSESNDTKGLFDDYSVVEIKDSKGNLTTVRFKFSIVNEFQFSFEPTPLANPTIAQVFISATASDGETYSNSAGTYNIGDNSYSQQITFSGSGVTASLNLDLSDLKVVHKDWDRQVKATAIGFTNVETRTSSLRALDTIKNRIDELSKVQGNFGAIESRLNVAANRLLVDRENFQSAASQITDVDVATEAASLAKTQILQQAATSILAQANQQPQIALQLLGGL